MKPTPKQKQDALLKARWAQWQREKNPPHSIALQAMIDLDLLECKLVTEA